VISNLVRDSLREVPEVSRVPELDRRAVAFERAVLRLVSEVAAIRADGDNPVISGLDLLVAEGVEVAEEAGSAEGYAEVAGAVAGMVAGLAGVTRG
jgi:hypothetical protein